MKNKLLNHPTIHGSKKTPIHVTYREITDIFPLHRHNFIEIELITSGNGYQIFNGKKININEGTLIISGLTDLHEIVPESPIQLFNMAIDDSILPPEVLNTIINTSGIICNLTEDRKLALIRLFELCRAECSETRPDVEYLKKLTECIFTQIFRTVPMSESPLIIKHTPIRTAVQFMHLHFRENPSLEEVANMVHYNPCHFSSIFRKEMNTCFTDYLNTLKINYAKELLQTTDLNMGIICSECGFTSYSNFLRLFKEKTGMSPSKYKI